MFRGYYTLTSEMLTSSRKLDNISNNMVNVATPGYKKDHAVSTTFQDEMTYRTGMRNRAGMPSIAENSMARTLERSQTDFTQGAMEETGSPMDIALTGPGFYQILTQNGYVYSRNGSFIVDDEGYMAISGLGRVMGKNGPIHLPTDEIQVESDGRIINDRTKELIGQLNIVDFADYDQLTKDPNGWITTAQQPIASNTTVLGKTIERSNVDPVTEMMDMMTNQRALQSASQVVKMYDQLMAKASTELGRI